MEFPFVDGHAHLIVRQRRQIGRRGFKVAQGQPRCERRDFLVAHRHSVICQQQQALRVLVQPPDGHTANRGIFRRKQVHHRRLLLVARGGQQSGGFVQHHMPCQAGIQLFAVQQDFRVLPHLHGRVALHVPIHADTPAANRLLHLRPAALAQRHQHSVKPQHLPAPSRPSRRAGNRRQQRTHGIRHQHQHGGHRRHR